MLPPKKQPEYSNTDVSKILENLTKYASKPLGFDKIFEDEKVLKKKEVEYASSLPLQIIIYFNIYFSIIWFFGCCFLWPLLAFKSEQSNRVWVILVLFAFVMMVIFEVVRLYLGFIGNLSERVPELTGFWLLTLMIEAPLSVFLLVISWLPLSNESSISNILIISQLIPMQFALQLVHAIFVYFELLFGFFALRVLARYQISRFHYKQFDEKYQQQLQQQYDKNADQTNNNMNWLENLSYNNYNKYNDLKKE